MYSTQGFQNKLPVIGNGNSYARDPIQPDYISQIPTDNYNHGTVPLETLPAQWWNWLNNQYTSRINNASNNTDGVFTNLFNELNNVLLDKGITPNANSSNQLVTALNKPRRTNVTSYNQLSSVKNGEILWIAFSGTDSVILPNGSNYCDIIVISSNTGTHTVTGAIRGGDITLGYGESVILMWHGSTWIILSASITYTGKKLFPIGSIYQNADNDTQPQQLLGFGYWQRITDRFLASYGSSVITQETDMGGRSEVVLSVNNLPAHNHDATFTGTRLNVNDAFWAVTQYQVGVQPGTGQATLVDNKSPFKNANFHNYTDKAVTTYHHTGVDVDCLSGGIGFDYTPEGTVTTENTGNGEAFSIIPPYYAVHTWKRIL